MDIRETLKKVVWALEDKKANNIKVLNISEVSSMGDYFIIADGANKNQIQAMSDNVEETMHNCGYTLKNREGYSNGGWILLDYYDIIIHIFAEEERSFYDLEHVWRDGISISLKDL